MKEIERKFLVQNDSWRTNLSELDSSLIQQGYLTFDPDRVVRVRIRDAKAFLTIKNRTVGVTREEFEYSIPVEDAQSLLEMALGTIIVKRRYLLKCGGHTWEVDEFFGKHEGLVLAEIELKEEQEAFETPDWLGEEVSADPTYFNMNLAK